MWGPGCPPRKDLEERKEVHPRGLSPGQEPNMGTLSEIFTVGCLQAGTKPLESHVQRGEPRRILAEAEVFPTTEDDATVAATAALILSRRGKANKKEIRRHPLGS